MNFSFLLNIFKTRVRNFNADITQKEESSVCISRKRITEFTLAVTFAVVDEDIINEFLPLSFCYQNFCSSDPCAHNATCLNGFTDKKYLCVCQIGFTGEHCEKGITNGTKV